MKLILCAWLCAQLCACTTADVKINPADWQCSSFMLNHGEKSNECTQYTKRVKAP